MQVIPLRFQSALRVFEWKGLYVKRRNVLSSVQTIARSAYTADVDRCAYGINRRASSTEVKKQTLRVIGTVLDEPCEAMWNAVIFDVASPVTTLK